VPVKKTPEPPALDDTQFGLNWTKAGHHNLPELQKRLYCARHGRGNVSAFEHRKIIIQSLWPNDCAWHYWSDRRLKSICDYNFVTWMGGGGIGKSADAAAIAIEYWLEAPHETAVIVCSTTAKELRGRIWSQIIRYYMKLPRGVFPADHGELLDASMMIRWAQGDWVNGIYGTAIQDGPVEEAINNIVGRHTKRVFWILDEMQQVREAIMGAIPNLLKNPETKMLGMGNPSSFTSMLCRYSEPIQGWKSIPQFCEEWEIRSNGYLGPGRALYFDGEKSPAILDPEWGKKNPWMTNRQQIDAHLESVGGNRNDPGWMTQSKGWPPQMGIEATVLDGAIITKFQCSDQPVWTDGFVQFAALDPAYDGGDDAILHIMRRGIVKETKDDSMSRMLVGPSTEERWVIAGHEQIRVTIDGDNASIPIDYQIVNFVKNACIQRGIPPEELAVAVSGRGAALKSIFEVEWGSVNGVEEGGTPSERVVEAAGKTAKEKYNTRASELCMAIREFALGNGIRGLPSDVQVQACARLTFNLNGKLCAEPKTATKGLVQAKGAGAKGFKQRLGYSPDELDAFVIGIEHARQKGAVPNFGMEAPQKAEDWNQKVTEEQEIDAYEETDWKSEMDYDFA
jgi:hypothetical protein